MRFWVTKYALTRGIIVADVDDPSSTNTPSLIVVRQRDNPCYGYFHDKGKDWHLTEQEAKARAEVMRVASIASHRMSIAKLEKLSFT